MSHTHGSQASVSQPLRSQPLGSQLSVSRPLADHTAMPQSQGSQPSSSETPPISGLRLRDTSSDPPTPSTHASDMHASDGDADDDEKAYYDQYGRIIIVPEGSSLVILLQGLSPKPPESFMMALMRLGLTKAKYNNYYSPAAARPRGLQPSASHGSHRSMSHTHGSQASVSQPLRSQPLGSQLSVSRPLADHTAMPQSQGSQPSSSETPPISGLRLRDTSSDPPTPSTHASDMHASDGDADDDEKAYYDQYGRIIIVPEGSSLVILLQGLSPKPPESFMMALMRLGVISHSR
uniref:Uncharacterized protein n=1 Tax=Nicotiana tabacum TaxID=4097 RepID=A0A1S4DEH9_TOBAC|nr:PREDICTED: uncharacterized protein LOC107828872 [Nicotiana tabacum]